jgi:hypothetical protein
MSETKSWLIKDVPDDVLKFVLKRQGDNKVKKGISQYSLSQTIFQIIKEHNQFPKKEKQ